IRFKTSSISTSSRAPNLSCALSKTALSSFIASSKNWRVPDAQLGYLLWDWLTMGQLLSLPMVVVGALLIAYAYRQNKVTV
ncbi:MAG: hypothetical protein U9N57_00625, partial [Pseudomonadota bacterium]|nr:hypothetical protein [Pseudomonadota bacterium]